MDEADVDRFLSLLPDVVARARAARSGRPGCDRGPADGGPRRTISRARRACPLPVIELARAIGGVPVGAVVAVLADDPAAATDIPAWCTLRGQAYLGAHQVDAASAFLVRRVS